RNYGDLNGKKHDDIKREHPDKYLAWHRSYEVPPPNGESIKDVEKRVLAFLNEVLPALGKEDVVFLSMHGNSLRPLRRYFENLSIDEMCAFEHPYGKVYRYES
ncbi:MAG: histidine phosphatase family protein, partial [Candidatus Micrarchaeaceae archaeon]